MSVALDLDFTTATSPVPQRRPSLRLVPQELPSPTVPAGTAPWRAVEPSADVTVLRAPSVAAVPLRLTRRGTAVLAVLTALAGLALVWAAAASAHGAGASAPARPGPAVVTVHSGDTLWALAARVAPQRDPRAEVAELRRLNHLTDPQLVPGQVLHLR